MALLKLIALDASDVTIVSAHLQDAVVRVGDIVYSPRERRFVAFANRFNRQIDAAADTQAPLERRRAALRIDGVTNVQSAGFAPDDRAKVLAILALVFAPDPDPEFAPAGTISVLCAGGATLRLTVECVEMAVEDLGPTWQASGEPVHPDAGDTSGATG